MRTGIRAWESRPTSARTARERIPWRNHRAWPIARATRRRGARGATLSGTFLTGLVLELGGQETYDRSIAAVAAGGRIAQVGVLTGFQPKPNVLPLQFANASIEGICVGSLTHFADLCSFLSKHGIKPVIARTYAFDEVESAYEDFASTERFGKVVISL